MENCIKILWNAIANFVKNSSGNEASLFSFVLRVSTDDDEHKDMQEI